MFKASRRLPWIYSGITIGMVVIAGIVFYFMSSQYIESLYYDYLMEKAHIIAMEKFKKDELDPVKYQNVVQRRQNSIPTSHEAFVNLTDTVKANRQLREYLSDEEIEEFYHAKHVNFTNGNEVGSIITYYDDAGPFGVLVLSRNPYGEEVSETIGWGILALVVIAAIILYLISRLYAIRIVERISDDYQAEKLFVNNASHEINNPLTAIQGECEISLLKARTQEDYKKAIERIANETDRIIRIMENLLNLSHMRSAEINVESLERILMSEFMNDYASERVEVQVVDDFSLLIREDLLRIAMSNIINNAQKYSGNGKVIVVVNRNSVTVKDFGIGISEEDLQHIFEPFYRAKNTSGFSGHGIGLSLSKAIIEKFGGKIKVSSAQDKGTTFKIIFKKFIG